MSGAYQIRPSFTVEHAEQPNSLAEFLLHTFADDTGDVHVQRVGQHVVLTAAADTRHFWSPWLHIEIEEADTGSLVRAKFSPHPNLWTSFAFGYFTLGTVVFFAGFFALAQMLTSQPAWAWWITGVAVFGLIVMWITAKVGQGLAHEQMHLLRNRLEETLTKASQSPQTHVSG
jgi:hypothetical protein